MADGWNNVHIAHCSCQCCFLHTGAHHHKHTTNRIAIVCDIIWAVRMFKLEIRPQLEEYIAGMHTTNTEGWHFFFRHGESDNTFTMHRVSVIVQIADDLLHECIVFFRLHDTLWFRPFRLMLM